MSLQFYKSRSVGGASGGAGSHSQYNNPSSHRSIGGPSTGGNSTGGGRTSTGGTTSTAVSKRAGGEDDEEDHTFSLEKKIRTFFADHTADGRSASTDQILDHFRPLFDETSDEHEGLDAQAKRRKKADADLFRKQLKEMTTMEDVKGKQGSVWKLRH